MKPNVRWMVLGVAVLVVIGLFVALRPSGDESPGGSAGGSAPASGSASPPAAAVDRIEVTVRNGTIDAPSDPTVSQGSNVEIVVHSDVAEEVHVHGYDLMKDVDAGGTATIDFVADAPGVFEVELEHAGTLLFELTVTP